MQETKRSLIPVRIAWQLMVGLGTLLAAVGALTLLGRWRRAVWLERPWFLGLVALGFLVHGLTDWFSPEARLRRRRARNHRRTRRKLIGLYS